MAENTNETPIAQQKQTQQKQNENAMQKDAPAHAHQKQAENAQQTAPAPQKPAPIPVQQAQIAAPAQNQAPQGSENTQEKAAVQPAKKELSLLMQLKAQKDALLEEAKTLNPKLSALRAQLAPMAAELKKTAGSNSSRLRSQIDEIEFKIATEAFTAKHEKELIKSKKGLEEQLKSASAADTLYKKVSELRAQLNPLSQRRDEIDAQLDLLRSQMSVEYEKSKTEYEKSKKDREKKAFDSLKARYGKKDERPNASAPGAPHPRFEHRGSHDRKPHREKLDADEAKYLKKHDDFVSLEDIVVMEKKEKKEEKEAEQENSS